MHTVVRHWWNQQWGRLGRRDVYIRTDGRAWEVEVLAGGADSGRSWRALFDTLAEAEQEAARHLHHEQDDWRDVSDAHNTGGSPIHR